MFKHTIGGALLGAVLLAAGCSEAVGPERRPSVSPPLADLSGSTPTGITLDRFNGSLGEVGTQLLKGFDPTNPQLGDAIVATFFWVGSSNIIQNVTDHLNDGTPVGNFYHPVNYVQAGGISMATYVATNVQNFPGPDPAGNAKVLVVEATLSAPGTASGGVLLSAWTGVDPAFARAVGAVSSASGTGDGTAPTAAAPGPINVGAGALAYGVTMTNSSANVEQPVGFARILQQSDGLAMASDGAYVVQATAGSLNPQWTWFFNTPSTWLANAVALNPAGVAPPPATQLAFTVQPSNAFPFATIQPPVQVTALDASGSRATTFNGDVTIAIGNDPGCPLVCATLSGKKTVTAVDGVATFADLSIDRPGSGYTLVVTSSGLTGAESNRFTILTSLPWP